MLAAGDRYRASRLGFQDPPGTEALKLPRLHAALTDSNIDTSISTLLGRPPTVIGCAAPHRKRVALVLPPSQSHTPRACLLGALCLPSR
jgi:hypothetical protein